MCNTLFITAMMAGLDLFIGAPGHFAKGNSSTIAVGAIYSAKDGQLRSVMLLRLNINPRPRPHVA